MRRLKHSGQALLEMIGALLSILALTPAVANLLLTHWHRIECQRRSFQYGMKILKQRNTENSVEAASQCGNIRIQFELRTLEELSTP